MSNPIFLYEVLFDLRRQKWLVAASVLFAMAVAVLWLLVEKPLYRASVTVIPVEDQGEIPLGSLGGQLTGLAALTGLRLGGGSSTLQESLGVLNSKAFSRLFIEKNGLLPILYEDIWDGDAKTWKADVETPPSLNDAVDYFERSIRTVFVDKKSGLISISMEWHNRELVADWANKMVSELNVLLRERAIEEAEISRGFLIKELDHTENIEVRSSIFRLIEISIQKVMFANVKIDYALKPIDPAVPPDPEDKVNLSAALRLSLAVALGFGFGSMVAVTLGAIRRRKADSENRASR